MSDYFGVVTFLFIIFFIRTLFIILQTEKRMMSGLYSIPLAGLREGRYTYDFGLGNDFFEAFEESEIRKGSLRADVTLDKRGSLLELSISIKGEVEVICDRCLEFFPLKISSANKLFIKAGEDWDDSDPEMLTMPVDEHQIDLSHFFYEYIHLALPIQRIHPDDNEGRSTCDPEMLKKLGEHVIENKKATDPRWDGLKKLK
jgi:uncharacterized protein